MNIELSPSGASFMNTTSAVQPDYATMARQLKVLSDPRRLEILDLLIGGVQCNCEIGDHLDMAPNLISHHISVLRKAGLVVAERDPGDARWIYYSIDESRLAELADWFGAFINPNRIRPRRPDCGPQAIKLIN
jgi:ArsR family transcriptional regulator, arsenate/arsenite/antimonite-responsive transcriptional repressor